MKPINRLELFIILLSFVGDALLLVLFFRRRAEERQEDAEKAMDADCLAKTIDNLTRRLEELEKAADEK